MHIIICLVGYKKIQWYEGKKPKRIKGFLGFACLCLSIGINICETV